MHLEKLRIQNFRSFDDETITLTKGLTIFVGENNGGKSNAIDASRLITSPLNGRRELYCEPTDIRFGSTSKRFDIEGRFTDLSAAQQGRMMSVAADQTLQTAVIGLTYDESKGQYPVRPSSWGGQHKVTPEAGCLDMVRHVYLPPLRDAKRALASGNPTRIHTLLKHFLGKDDPKELVKRLQRAGKDKILTAVDGAVDVGLKELTSGVRRQGASLGFSNDEELIDIARDLRFKLADHGIEPEDISYSGHGYANLLYMATIAVELENIKTSELTLFLVEEPEAHLHPQLQAAVLCFLEEQAEKSRKPKENPNAPAGHLQIVVATHSPNLSAWVDSKNLVFFKSAVAKPAVEPEKEAALAAAAAPANPDAIEAKAPVAAAPAPAAIGVDAAKVLVPVAPAAVADAVAFVAAPTVRRVTRTIPLSELKLSVTEQRKVDRYIDVTKSAFLFGGRVLMVEGIAEALLLPVVAKRIVFKGNHEKYRQFRTSVFVPIDGVDFDPYVKLLLTPHKEIHIADRVVVVTDGDRKNQKVGEKTPGELRRDKLVKIVSDLKVEKELEVFINTYTLEAELVLAGNTDLMKSVYLELHPESEAKWNEAIALKGDEQAAKLKEIFKTTRKGDFAQILAERIFEGKHFNVPKYLSDAIEALVK